MQTKIELTARGRICLLLLNLTAAAAWLTGDDSARLAASMLAAPFFVDLLHKHLRRPVLEFHLAARRTQAGSLFLESIRIHNPGTRAARHLRITEPRTHTISGGAYVDDLPAGSTVTLKVAARIRRRGKYQSRTLNIDTCHPLGLFRWRADLTVRSEIITEPARLDLTAEIHRALDSAREEPHPGQRRDGREFHSLREYEYGEDARHVHARRSATTGTLVSREYRGQLDPECSLILDLRRPPGIPAHVGRAHLENQLSLTATLTDLLLADGVELHVFVIQADIERHEVVDDHSAADFLSLLAEAASVEFHALPDEFEHEFAGAGSCLWLPAGGHRPADALMDRRGFHYIEGDMVA